jgi:hypothetical protein
VRGADEAEAVADLSAGDETALARTNFGSPLVVSGLAAASVVAAGVDAALPLVPVGLGGAACRHPATVMRRPSLLCGAEDAGACDVVGGSVVGVAGACDVAVGVAGACDVEVDGAGFCDVDGSCAATATVAVNTPAASIPDQIRLLISPPSSVRLATMDPKRVWTSSRSRHTVEIAPSFERFF